MLILYGTAWKEGETERLVTEALRSGFRAIDSANQRKHYFEEGAGRAVKQEIVAGALARADLFLQSKFTHIGGQDHRLPYDEDAPTKTQVLQSLESTLKHFGTEYLDSYLIHGPESGGTLTENDWAAWKAMEALFQEGRARTIGVSNFTLSQLAVLHAGSSVKPSFLQNRCYPAIGWDRGVRGLCKRLGVCYQAFNLVRPPLLGSPVVAGIAKRVGATPAQVIYAWAMRSGMVPMTGTTNSLHMKEALAATGLELSASDLDAVEQLASGS